MNASYEKLYIVMNKPAGYVCSAVSDSHKTVYELLPENLRELMNAKRGQRLHSIGRLDCDTSGLLLFTNDGFFSHQLTAPDQHVFKTYKVKLASHVSKDKQQAITSLFAKGITLPPEKKAPEQQCSPAQITFFSEVEAEVIIQEGKFHQVRRMFRAVKNEVVELKRISVGNFMLPGELAPGEYRFLSEEEIQSFMNLSPV